MNTLKLDITSLEIDDQQNEISSKDNNRYFDYNETFSTQVILPPNSLYKTITFAEVTSPFALVIVSDKEISAKINGVEFTNTKMILLNTAITSLQIANADSLAATVTIYIWGVQQ